MKVIADSGSTKTDWRLIPPTGNPVKAQTIGLNPYYVSGARFNDTLQASDIANWPTNEIDVVYFYSAGITDVAFQVKLTNWLKKHFPYAKVNVESDLLAAARATFGLDSGVVGILGTGSNSGYYDGTKITENIKPLGYILGDEGSGNALGKRLIKEFLRNTLPEGLVHKFKDFCVDYENLLANIYADKQGSRFLASFVPFIAQHLDDQYLSQLAKEEFEKYFDILKGYSQRKELALVGSVAYYFTDILQEISAERGFTTLKVIKSPIDSLLLFHQ